MWYARGNCQYTEGDSTRSSLLGNYPPALSSLHAVDVYGPGETKEFKEGLVYKAHRHAPGKSKWWCFAKSWSSICGDIREDAFEDIYDIVIVFVICNFILIEIGASECIDCIL